MPRLASDTRFKVTPLSGVLAAQIDDIDLRDVDSQTFEDLRGAFLKYHVLVFPGQQHLTPEQHVSFGSLWGQLHETPTPDACLPGHPKILVLDFKGRKPATDQWHSDLTMEEHPPMGSVLLGRVIPVGGDTIFANQHAAYDALSEGMKRLIDGLYAVHDGVVFARSGGYDPAIFPTSVHPVVRTHPETGRKALFVNGVYTSCIQGLTAEESAPLLKFLCDHCVQPNFTFRHRWTAGDLLMWDNRSVQHFAVADYGSQQRTMHRVTIRGDRPI